MPSELFKMILTRADVTECTRCQKPLDPQVKFMGRKDPQGSRFDSDCGWWLRVEHVRDSIWHDVEDHDRIGDCLCPECKERSHKLMMELLGD